MEVEKEVKTFKVDIKCPDCEIIMKIDQKISGVSDGWFYFCPNCNSSVIENKKYPYLKYKYI